MLLFIRRMVIVAAAVFAIFLLSQYALFYMIGGDDANRTSGGQAQMLVTIKALSAGPTGPQPLWTFVMDDDGQSSLDGRPTTVEGLMLRIVGLKGPVELQAVRAGGPELQASWTCRLAADGSAQVDGQSCSRDELRKKILGLIQTTRPVTVRDVLAAKVPCPTKSKVSFPKFTYQQAFPDAKDQPEYTITHFQEATIFADRSKMPEKWRKYYPEKLPPVEERLPLNPAVDLGPDGIGQYIPGRSWRMSTTGSTDVGNKLGYESFMRFDPSGNLQPALAYKWEVADNNRVFTFYLRPGHKWSDGQPFTSQDILWVVNDVVGSQAWGDHSDWMCYTDGSSALYAEDIKDFRALARRILAERDRSQGGAGAAPSAGLQVWLAATETLRARLETAAREAPLSEDEQLDIVEELNKVFINRSFLTTKVTPTVPATGVREEEEPSAAASAPFSPAWAALDLATEEQSLFQDGPSRMNKEELDYYNLMQERRDLARLAAQSVGRLEKPQVSRLGLLLFRAAFAEQVDRPRKKRVKIEAVADANGDSSHIVRFTFEKPNSTFLENCCTFMFYRGLFSTSYHVSREFHIAGRSDFNVIDVFNWPEFVKRIQAAGEAAAPSPGKQLWSRLSPELQQRLRSKAPADRRFTDDDLDPRGDPYKNEIVAEINRVLADPSFYDPGAWAGVDLDGELAAFRRDGFCAIAKDRKQVNRLNELMVREDLLKRRLAKGPGDLKAAEVFQLNLLLLRAAFSRGAADEEDYRQGQLARNREDALNREAVRHPRKYTSWITRWQKRGSFHPIYNTNNPTIGGWRLISEGNDLVHWAIRNPYYYRVDTVGNQLPYIDALEFKIESQKQSRALDMLSGNVDAQWRDVEFEDFTVLKQGEKRGNYKVLLWANDYCGEMTFACGESRKDPEYAKVLGDARFHQALSLALNRQEMIDVVWQGMGTPAQFSVPEGSKYYDPLHTNAYIEYSPAKANALLDAMGLTKRGPDGTRQFPSGRPLVLDVNAVPERPLAAVQMACSYWQAVGVNAQLRVRTSIGINQLLGTGEMDILVHKEGGNYFGPALAGDYAPTHPAESQQWQKWTEYLRTNGRTGWEAPDRIRKLNRLLNKMIQAGSEEEKIAGWMALSASARENLPVIAITTSPGKVVYVKNNFKNVPKLSLAGWIAHDPGNNNPECFFFSE